MERSTPQVESAALRHPLWWFALVTLLLNDHVLKGAALLPEVLTGKLSDVAGLLVAPALLAALFAARSVTARALCLLVVALPFAAINLWSPAALWLSRALDALGLPAAIWTDPSDLIALAALPLSWRLTRPAPARPRADLRRFAGVSLAGAACLATNQPPPVQPWLSAAFVANDSDSVVTLRLRWADARLDCEGVGADPAAALAPAIFKHGLAVSLETFDTLPIQFYDAYESVVTADTGGVPPDTGTAAPQSSIGGDCQAVLIQAEGLPDTIALFDARYRWSIPYNLDGVDDDTVEAPGVFYREDLDRAVAIRRGDITLATPEPTLPTTRCDARGAPTSYEWSSSWPERDTLDAIHVLPDGCLQLRFADAGEAFLCAPAERVPFEAGEALAVQEDGLSLVIEGASRRLTLMRGAGSERLDVVGAIIERADCEGERHACGAYTSPALVRIGDALLRPGDAAALSDGRVVAIGRAERVWVGRDDCSTRRRQIGDSVDLLLLEELP